MPIGIGLHGLTQEAAIFRVHFCFLLCVHQSPMAFRTVKQITVTTRFKLIKLSKKDEIVDAPHLIVHKNSESSLSWKETV